MVCGIGQAFFTRIEPAARPGQAPLDEQQVALGVGAHDADLLDGHALVAHVAGHPQAAVDATRRGARADRARRAVMVGTVGLGPAVEVVALDVAGEALALGDAGHVDEVAGLEQVTSKLSGRPRSRRRVHAELADARRPCGRSLSWPASGFVSFLRDVGADLDGRVAVALGGPQLRDRVRLDGDDRDGHMCRRSAKTCVMPTLRPISPTFQILTS